jgi:hypothetical protein
MAKNRTGEFYKEWVPWFTASGLLYILPWLWFAVVARPDLLYWIPAICYAGVLGLGKVIRQNHLIPFIPWLAMSAMASGVVVILALVDFVAAGFYFGDIWRRHYTSLAAMNEDARAAGEWLKDKQGIAWVNGIHTGIYIYAEKCVPFGLAEQIEIREVATERRVAMKAAFKADPPEWVVQGVAPGVEFSPRGYKSRAEAGENIIYKRL